MVHVWAIIFWKLGISGEGASKFFNLLKKSHDFQAGWERKMLRSLNSMCQELGIHLAGSVSCLTFARKLGLNKRDSRQSEAILMNWTELSLVFNSCFFVYSVSYLFNDLIFQNHHQSNLFLALKICWKFWFPSSIQMLETISGPLPMSMSSKFYSPYWGFQFRSTGRLFQYWGLFNLPIRVKNLSELVSLVQTKYSS